MNGFLPKVTAREFDFAIRSGFINLEDFVNMKPLGDIEETLLARTLDEIFGISKTTVKSVDEDRFKFIGSAIDRTPARQTVFKHE